jgi:hypothetical protein
MDRWRAVVNAVMNFSGSGATELVILLYSKSSKNPALYFCCLLNKMKVYVVVSKVDWEYVKI